MQNHADTGGPRPRDNTPRDNIDGLQLTPVTPAEDIRTIMLNRVSWGAVSAGVAIALAAQLVLNLLGLGFGVLAPDSATQTLAGPNFTLGAGLWWTFSGVLAAFLGGLTAGRLAGEPQVSTAGWHGLTCWAVSVLVVAFLFVAVGGAAMMNGVYMKTSPAQAGILLNAPPSSQAAIPQMPGTLQIIPGPARDAMKLLSRAALVSALTLALSALFAWLGGRAGTVKPTITERRLRYDASLH